MRPSNIRGHGISSGATNRPSPAKPDACGLMRYSRIMTMTSQSTPVTAMEGRAEELNNAPLRGQHLQRRCCL